jgi:probable selenium-dependent hydroxylase accessory protein YqeC
MIEFFNKLRVEHPLCISIVGAGGKTTLMSLLAKQLSEKNICTTTTKLAVHEADLFSGHLNLQSQSFNTDFSYLQERDLLITNGTVIINQVEKLQGLNEAQLSELWKHCQDRFANLLIEADGAKRRLLKAPAEWEPVIADFSDLVIYVICPKVLGKVLNEENVFRSQLFSEMVGSDIGETIDSRMITRYLIHQQGGLKNIPDHAKKILFSDSHGSIGSENLFSGEELQDLADHFDHYFDGNLKQTMLRAGQIF